MPEKLASAAPHSDRTAWLVLALEQSKGTRPVTFVKGRVPFDLRW